MDAVEVVCYIVWRIYWYLRVELLAVTYTLWHGFTVRRKPAGLIKCHAEVAIVTGGLHGIGREITRQLLDMGVTVYTAGPELPENSQILKEFQETYGITKVSYIPLDLSSMKSVRRFAEIFISKQLCLNVLICNAGIMFTPLRVTCDGFESQLAINYLGHAYLTILLLPVLVNSGNDKRYSRVVMVTSCIHLAGDFWFQDLNAKQRYSPELAYAQSKLANVTFAFYLNGLLAAEGYNVTVNAVSPGVARTSLCKDHRWYHGTDFGQWFFKSATEGAYCSVYAAFSEEMEGTGGIYLDDCQVTNPNPRAKDPELQRRLWTETCKLLGIEDMPVSELIKKRPLLLSSFGQNA